MTTIAISTIKITATIPITTEIVDTSLAVLLSDGEFVMVMLDDNFGSPVICSVVSSASHALTIEESV